MNKIKKLFMYIFAILLSKIIKRDKNIWIFRGFADNYVDNSKYLLEYVNSNTNITSIWLTNKVDTCEEVIKKGFSCYMKKSIKGIYFAIKAKFHFYGDYNDYLTSQGAITINLWHGIPLKKIEFDISTGPLKNIFDGSSKSKRLYHHIYKKPNYVLSTSSYASKNLFSSAFRINANNCLNFGYPRNDIMYGKTNKDKSKYASYAKTFIYLPTWRDDGNDFIKQSGIDFMKLNKLMQENNSFFIFKLHPATHLEVDLSQYSNVGMMDKGMDLYELLPLTDTLITDYSSVFFDYMLLDKDVIFFPFDYDNYIKDREFYFEYDDIFPTKPVYNFGELCDRLFSDFMIDEKYTNIKDMFWKYKDGLASKRITEYFLNYEDK